MPNPYNEFIDKAKASADEINNMVSCNSHFLVCYHFDADGLAAAGILGKALRKMDATIHLKVVKQIDSETLESLSRTTSDAIVLVDIGSGYLNLINTLTNSKKIFVLDHHQINGGNDDNDIVHVNPHLFGIDGSKELSGAGVTYFVAKAMSEENIDLSPLAVVGSLGDMQDKDGKRELRGLNSIVVRDAVEKGLLKVETDLIIYGRETRPIHKALSNTVNPFLPGLSGEEDNCLALLSSSSIPIKIGERWRTVMDLSIDEKQRMLSTIVEFLASKGFEGAKAMNLIGSVYTLLKEERWTPTRDAREYATLLNACGRMGRPSLAIALAVGERGATLEEANKVLSEHRKTLAEYMSIINSNPQIMENLESILVIHGEGFINENMTGAVSSMLSSSETFPDGKIIVVSAKTRNGDIKISARISGEMVRKGVNLGSILQNLAKKHGGFGGGHDIAAGAQIPLSEWKNFLEGLNLTVHGLSGNESHN
ncbi:MAG: DHHA1 domain-containing protein [Candidatus Bathyarchaeia archaeon]